MFKPEDFYSVIAKRDDAANCLPDMAKVANAKHEECCGYQSQLLTVQRENRQLELENGRFREALKLILYTNRSRGYPTGPEWIELVKVVTAALEGK